MIWHLKKRKKKKQILPKKIHLHIISTQLYSDHLIFIKLMHFRCLQLFHDMIHRLHLLYCITEETHFPILFTCSEGHLQQDTL